MAAAVVDIPKGVGIMIGMPGMLQTDALLDFPSYRVCVRAAREVVRMDLIHRIQQRMQEDGWTVLSLCTWRSG